MGVEMARSARSGVGKGGGRGRVEGWGWKGGGEIGPTRFWHGEPCPAQHGNNVAVGARLARWAVTSTTTLLIQHHTLA